MRGLIYKKMRMIKSLLLISFGLCSAFWSLASGQQVCQYVIDFSGLNSTCVSVVVTPETEEDIRQALIVARRQGLKVSVSGAKHTMAGQALNENGLLLDMVKFNRILCVDTSNKIVHVQSGATWADLQAVLDPEGLAVDVMQEFNLFTIGGSLSVNAVGGNIKSGPLASTVVSLRMTL